MTTSLRVFCVVSALCAIGFMSASHAQTVTCQNAQFDPAVLARYPDLQKNCLDVIRRGNEDYAVVTAKLEKVNSNGYLVVRSKRADGSYGERRTLRPPDDMRVLIAGKPADVRELAKGQDVTAYVRVTAPAVMALVPDNPDTPLYPTSLGPERMAALPATASVVPVIALLGSAFLLLGGVLTAIRRRH